jgi:hypothetical protein
MHAINFDRQWRVNCGSEVSSVQNVWNICVHCQYTNLGLLLYLWLMVVK